MKVHNIGSKIVNIGSTALMPGDSMDITEIQAGTPAIKVLAKHNFLRLDEGSQDVNDTPQEVAGNIEPQNESVNANQKQDKDSETEDSTKAEDTEKASKSTAKPVKTTSK
jgi:hypothetical protein